MNGEGERYYFRRDKGNETYKRLFFDCLERRQLVTLVLICVVVDASDGSVDGFFAFTHSNSLKRYE